MKKNSAKSRLLTAAMTGLLTVGMPAFASAHNSTTQNNDINISKTSAKSGARSGISRFSRGTVHVGDDHGNALHRARA
jgi:hypothetical protein